MYENLLETKMYHSCKMCKTWMLWTFLFALSCKLSTASNKINPDSNSFTLSPVIGKLYSTTAKLQLNGLKLAAAADDDISVNNTLLLDALPMPISGCKDPWKKASLSLSNTSTLTDMDVSEAPHFSHLQSSGTVQDLHFCTWKTDEYRKRFAWSHENYCFIVFISIDVDVDKICPDNFYKDTLFNEYHTFELSSWSTRIVMDRCCREVNSTSKPPSLTPPFYLLSNRDESCPTIEGSDISIEIMRFQESYKVKSIKLCYYEKDSSWTFEQKLELGVYIIVLGTPTTTLLIVCLCQIRTRTNKRKFAYSQRGFSSNNTQASIMFRQSTHSPQMKHQPSSSSLNERKGCKASTKF
ncbi:uncharacterized protein [Antedon mediterranea]|uniref:uncharacterized protein n=1 Tax=Antedon mediterranea TaxID=105859 RepID=UPI003AF5E1C7